MSFSFRKKIFSQKQNAPALIFRFHGAHVLHHVLYMKDLNKNKNLVNLCQKNIRTKKMFVRTENYLVRMQ